MILIRLAFLVYGMIMFSHGMTFFHANDIFCQKCSRCPAVQYLGYQSPSTVSSMQERECENELIVKLSELTSDSITDLEQLSKADLIGYSYGLNALWYFNTTTTSELSSMSLSEERDLIISDITTYYPFALRNSTQLSAFNVSQLANIFISYQITQLQASQNNPNLPNEYVAEVQAMLGDLVHINQSNIVFDVMDSMGNRMEGITVIELTSMKYSYYAVYHVLDTSAKQYNIHLAQSTDLIHWQYVRKLLDNASMPSVYNVYDQGNAILLLHQQFMNTPSAVPSRLGFKLYMSANDFNAGEYEYSYTASLTQGCASGFEGAPNIYYANSNLHNTAIYAYIGFQYNNNAGMKQNAFGILYDFGLNDDSLSWTTYDESTYNTQFNQEFHAIGDMVKQARFGFNGLNYVIQQTNIDASNTAGNWRLWIWIAKSFDYQTGIMMHPKMEGDVYLLNMLTPLGSYSFGNPSLTALDCPLHSGQNYVCVFGSYYIFDNGDEQGTVIFYKYYGV